MLEEQALVVSIEQDRAFLEIVRRTPCGLCGQTKGCGISVWGRLFGQRNNVFQAANPVNAKIGDSVVVGINERALLLTSLVIYGAPLLLVLLGAAIGTWLAPARGDSWSLAGAGAGLAASLLWIKLHAASRGREDDPRPVILRVADQDSQLKTCRRGA